MKKNVHTAGKSRKQKKIMLLILEFVIILLLAIALFITTKLSKIEKNKLDMNDVSINDDLSDETKEAMAHYKTIALFGLDNRSNGSLSKGNSDVIMLANIDTKQHTINLVSVYRDSYLDTGNGTYQKCNAAYAKGGPEQALSMLNTNLDLAITDYVTVDFNAIIECVDLLGGVDITITDDEASLMIGYMKELNREDFKADYIYLWEDEDIIKDYIEINNPEAKLITYNKKNSISYEPKGYYYYQDIYTKKYTLIDSIIYNFKQTLDKQEKYLVVCDSYDIELDNLEPKKVLLDKFDIINLKSNEHIFDTEKEANEYLIGRIKYKVNTLSDNIEYLKRSLVRSKADLKKCQKQLKKAELQFNEKYNNTTDLENNEVELD